MRISCLAWRATTDNCNERDSCESTFDTDAMTAEVTPKCLVVVDALPAKTMHSGRVLGDRECRVRYNHITPVSDYAQFLSKVCTVLKQEPLALST
jgi:hypothetical protein